MSRNAQTPGHEEALLPPLTISQTVTRVSLLACIGIGTVIFLKSQKTARQHLASTTKVAETIANCHRQATERLIRENERGVQRIVEVLRENQSRLRVGGGGDRVKMEGVRFEDEYGKWNGYTRDSGGKQWARVKDRYPYGGVGKAEGVRFQDHYSP
ncbi:hypothetical protein AC578_10279 [Pseudocercospora eumusae]|uniref:Uncharacterized protein n=1 Tax=Pseudocercospora eumusae TaxID=321146 RepID=A0A139HRA4_9PEZI|nr:hypothetical protein AC578_10279 [Pseudocercospora eumusae]